MRKEEALIVNDTITRNTIQLVPEDFKNELFKKNLAFFKEIDANLYKIALLHQPSKYRLCLNPDGSANILHLRSKQLVYHTSEEEISKNTDNKIASMPRHLGFNAEYALQATEQIIKYSPVQFHAYEKLLESGPFENTQVSKDNTKVTLKHQDKNNFIPYLRVYGLGLGDHLIKLIQSKEIVFINIYEPNIDLFYTSLFIVPWEIIFKYFNTGHKKMNLIIGTSVDNAVKSESKFIATNFPLMPSHCTRINVFENIDAFNQLIAEEAKTDRLINNELTAGWYDDQKIGLYNCLLNVNENKKFYIGNKTHSFLRVFVIGSGPSLNETIGYIKDHQNDAMVFSCGSALNPLLAADIVPDFEIVQERIWHKTILGDLRSEHTKEITLLKLNVVSPSNDTLYKDTFIFQKFNDPGSALLPSNYPSTTAVNPTVTNAGIAFASELGANEVYLFGVDYGAPEDTDRMHANNTIYDDKVSDTRDAQQNLKLKGNFGNNISSNDLLHWSLKVTETRVKASPETKWFNVGDGAFIEGTEPTQASDLPTKFNAQINKAKLRTEIEQCFSNNYSPDEVFDRFEAHHLKIISEYLDTVESFMESTPTSRELVIHVLNLIFKAVDIGREDSQFMPATLLAGGIKRLLENIYIQNALSHSDDKAEEFFNQTKEIFRTYFSEIKEDLDYLFDCAKQDIEIWH